MINKLLFLVGLLCLSYTVSFGQETEKTTTRKLSFSPYIGLNITDMKGGRAFDKLSSGAYSTQKSSSINTVAFGVDAMYKFTKYFGVNSGLFVNIYSSTQISNTPGMQIWYEDFYTWDNQLGRKNYMFINLPIQGVVNLPFSSKTGIQVMGGGYVGYFLYAGYTNEGSKGGWGASTEDVHSALAKKYDNVNVGLLGDARLYGQISAKIDIWAGVRYTYSLNELKNNAIYSEFSYKSSTSVAPIGQDFNFTPSALGFLVGITIKK